eukprot:gene6462-39890_t
MATGAFKAFRIKRRAPKYRAPPGAYAARVTGHELRDTPRAVKCCCRKGTAVWR